MEQIKKELNEIQNRALLFFDLRNPEGVNACIEDAFQLGKKVKKILEHEARAHYLGETPEQQERERDIYGL